MLSAEQFPSEASGVGFAVPERRRPNTLPEHRDCFAKRDRLHSPRAQRAGSPIPCPEGLVLYFTTSTI